MTDILTVTMNPAVDVSTSAAQVTPTHKLRCAAPRHFPGGGGINVARVVQRLGGDVAALYPVGGLPGQQLRRMVDDEGVRSLCLDIGGDTRESFSVLDRARQQEYRFVLPGPVLTSAEWQACLDRIAALTPPPHYLVASGSLPPGVPDDFYARLATLARALGSQFVLDSSGPALAAALGAGVFLVKPSLRELRELSGQPLASAPEWQAAAQALVAGGQAQVVALSLGERGALLVTADAVCAVPALAVPVASTTGAGDSFVGAMVWALARGDDLRSAFRHGVAAGAATLLSQGSALCQAADVRRLYPAVQMPV